MAHIFLIYKPEHGEKAENDKRMLNFQGCSEVTVWKDEHPTARALVEAALLRLGTVNASGDVVLILTDDDMQPLEVHSDPTQNELYQVALIEHGLVA